MSKKPFSKLSGYWWSKHNDERLIDDMGLKLNQERRNSRFSIYQHAAAAKLGVSTIERLIFDGKGNVLSLLRAIDALDCDIVLVKRRKVRKFWEIPGADERLTQLRKIQYDQNKLKSEKRRAKLKQSEDENDFLRDAGVSDEV